MKTTLCFCLGMILMLVHPCATAGTPFQWEVTGSLNMGRAGHAAVLLTSGKVLVAGGESGGGLKTAELYDPETGVWTRSASLRPGHAYTTGTLLPDGTVLVATGANTALYPSGVAELYNPATGIWKLTGRLNDRREEHTATLLQNGKVLVVGGYGSHNYDVLESAELYD